MNIMRIHRHRRVAHQLFGHEWFGSFVLKIIGRMGSRFGPRGPTQDFGAARGINGEHL